MSLTDDERRERQREYSRRYREANLEKVREYGRQYAAANPEKNRQWRAANAEKVRERDREHARWRRAANPEKRNEQARQRRAANPEKYREAERRRRAADPEKVRERKRQSYARNRGKVLENSRRYKAANPEKTRAWRLRRNHDMLPKDWGMLWDAQQGLCYLCGEPMVADDAAVDHDHSCCGGARSCDACRRGLAHNACNRLIGLCADDPDKLIRIAENLRAANRRTAERIAAKPVRLSLWPEDSWETS